MINTVQQIGGSIGTAVLSSMFASAVASHLEDKAPSPEVIGQATLDGYHIAFWIGAALFAGGAVISALVFRSGPVEVDPDAEPVIAH